MAGRVGRHPHLVESSFLLPPDLHLSLVRLKLLRWIFQWGSGFPLLTLDPLLLVLRANPPWPESTGRRWRCLINWCNYCSTCERTLPHSLCPTSHHNVVHRRFHVSMWASVSSIVFNVSTVSAVSVHCKRIHVTLVDQIYGVQLEWYHLVALLYPGYHSLTAFQGPHCRHARLRSPWYREGIVNIVNDITLAGRGESDVSANVGSHLHFRRAQAEWWNFNSHSVNMPHPQDQAATRRFRGRRSFMSAQILSIYLSEVARPLLAQ